MNTPNIKYFDGFYVGLPVWETFKCTRYIYYMVEVMGRQNKHLDMAYIGTVPNFQKDVL